MRDCEREPLASAKRFGWWAEFRDPWTGGLRSVDPAQTAASEISVKLTLPSRIRAPTLPAVCIPPARSKPRRMLRRPSGFQTGSEIEQARFREPRAD
jgi:hypothetical protein